jgi:hypothetical protein
MQEKSGKFNRYVRVVHRWLDNSKHSFEVRLRFHHPSFPESQSGVPAVGDDRGRFCATCVEFRHSG